MDALSGCDGFVWDENNYSKNWHKHDVSPSVCEQVFFNIPLVISDDLEHSSTEKRYYALGRSDEKRFLFIVFTVRNNKIRVISARDMSRKERKEYELHKEDTQIQE